MGKGRDFVKFSVDTSIFIRFERYYDRTRDNVLWDILERSIQDGSMLVSKVVIEELEQKDKEMSKWIKRINRNSIIEPNQKGNKILSELANKYPGWLDPNSTKINADPFVIALAKEYDTAVLSNEQRNLQSLNNLKPNNVVATTKIPEICKLENILHFDLPQFLVQVGLR